MNVDAEDEKSDGFLLERKDSFKEFTIERANSFNNYDEDDSQRRGSFSR